MDFESTANFDIWNERFGQRCPKVGGQGVSELAARNFDIIVSMGFTLLSIILG